jgi:hypothetical protein
LPRNQVHQPLEGRLHRAEVRVDVGVVELHVGQNQPIGKIMQKFGPFVEEGCVVFVALHDEGARGPKLKAGAEVLRHAADQKRRLERRILSCGHLIDPRQHAGGRGFSVRAGHHQRLAPQKKLLMQQGGHRGEGNALVQYALDLRIAARERVADDDEIRGRIKVRLRVRLHDRNAQPREQIAHGRISRLVGAGDAVALQLQKAGQRGHRRAADAAQVNVPGQ